MSKKEDTPLQGLMKESDALQKKVSALDKECSSYFKKKDKRDPEKGKEIYTRCKEYLMLVGEFKERLDELDQEAENMKPNKFQSKKKDETKKYKNIEDKLNKVHEKLKPEQEEEEEEGRKEEEEEEECEEEEEEENGEDKKKEVKKEEKDKKKKKQENKEDDEEDEEETDDDDDDDDDEEEEEEEDDVKENKKEGKKEDKKEDKKESKKEDTKEDKKSRMKSALEALKIGKTKSGQTQKTVTMKDDRKPSPGREKEGKHQKRDKTEEQKVEVEEEDNEDEEEVSEEEEEEEEEEEREEEEVDEEEEEEEEEEEGESEDEEEEEEDEEEESEEEEEETDMEQTSTMRQYIALDDFVGEEKGDLGFKKGEILTIIAARSDGWLEAENSEGKRGLVPITYLQVYNKYTDLEHEEESASDAEEEEEMIGTTPPQTPKSARDLWKDIKSAVKETSATDVLHALGAMPAGFRESTLYKLTKQGLYSARGMLTPKLSQSCVAFRDLFLDDTTDTLLPRNVRMQKIVTIIQAKLIPLPGTGADVISRQARVCLFDGQNILSNIHTIKVTNTDKEQKTWNFNNKIADLKHSVEFGEVFIRTNSSDPNIGVLIELCVTFKRTSTGQEGELSCGWVHFKLCDQDGKHLPSKTYDEFVSGGTIYERGVDVDPSVGKKAVKMPPSGSSKFRSLVAGNKQPRLILRIADPTKEQKLYLDTLPEVMVSSTAYISYISYYRHIQADLIIRDRDDQQSSELIYGPILNAFPDVLEQPDIMDVLRTCWAEEMKSMKRTDKKEITILKERFRRVFFHSVYPLTMCASLPDWDVCHDDIIRKRYEEIQRLHTMNKGQKIPKSLLSSEVLHKPLDIKSLAFNIVNPYCMVKAHGI